MSAPHPADYVKELHATRFNSIPSVEGKLEVIWYAIKILLEGEIERREAKYPRPR